MSDVDANADWTYLATLALLVRQGKAKLGRPGEAPRAAGHRRDR